MGSIGPKWTTYEPPAHETSTRLLAGILEGSSEDCRRFAQAAREAKLNELHIKFNLTWEEFCLKHLNNVPEFIDAIVLGVDVIGDEMPIPVGLAERVGKSIQKLNLRADNKKAAKVREGKHPGRPKKVYNKKNDVHFNQQPIKRGNSRENSLRRLELSRPDLHTKCLSGEMTANAAMVEAGYRKKQPSRKQPLITRIQRLWQQADTDERDCIIQWVLAQIAEGTSHG